MNEDLIQKFGFCEMYEWADTPDVSLRLGRFVSFSKSSPDKIELFHDNDSTFAGITSINSVADSDDPNEWKYKNMCNEVGDVYLQRERLAVGQKVYDQLNEINYIQTRPWEHYITIPSQAFDESKQYVKRSRRQEWVRVNLLGKAIVVDDGTCKPGEYCKPYTGKIKPLMGTAVKANSKDKIKFYVLDRISNNTILVINKNL